MSRQLNIPGIVDKIANQLYVPSLILGTLTLSVVAYYIYDTHVRTTGDNTDEATKGKVNNEDKLDKKND